MRNVIISALILLAASCAGNSDWTLTQDCTGKSYPAEVPSTVAAVLLENGQELTPEALEGSFTYSTVLKAQDLSKYYSLRFDGLGYYADIFFNGEKIASKDTTFGVFAVREFDVTPLVKKSNRLEVRLERARPGDLNHGWVDWSPAPEDASMGLVRGVTFRSHGAVSIKDMYVHPILNNTLDNARIEVRALLANHSDAPAEVVLKGVVEGREFTHKASLAARETREEVFDGLEIANPRLWWTHDTGTPELYSMNLSAFIDGAITDDASRTFGIRKFTSRLNENGHRQYTLNGRDILVAGAGWADDRYLRDTHESIEHQVNMVKDMGLNCIRFENIWGKDSYVYDLCDSKGILAITGFSCQWEWEGYCGIPHDEMYGCINDPERNALAFRYFKDQMRWIRNHPSIASFLTGSDRIANPQLEPLYLEEFKALGLEFSYICSAASKVSLAGPSGNKMTGPYEYCGPEYWVNPKAVGGALGFNTETGIGLNMPQYESVVKMIAPADRWPVGKAWDALCTVAGEGMHDTRVIKEVVEGQYGEPSNIEQFVSRAQAADYTGTRGMFEAFRINIGKATGVVQWMLNSAVPMLYWQLYDWYGIPTAGYYGTKKALQPVQLLLQWEERKLYAVNGTATGGKDASLECTVRIFDAASREIQTVPLSVTVPEGTSVPVLDIPAGEDLFVFVEGGADNFYAVPAQGNVHDYEHSIWFQTPISTYAGLQFVTRLPAPDLKVTEDAAGNVTVTNDSDTVAWQIVLKILDRNGELVPEALWSDNFFSLPPHSSKTVSHTGKGKLAWSAGL